MRCEGRKRDFIYDVKDLDVACLESYSFFIDSSLNVLNSVHERGDVFKDYGVVKTIFPGPF